VEAAEGTLQVFGVGEPDGEVLAAEFTLEKVFDEVFFGGGGEDAIDGVAGQGCGDALAAEVAQDALAAEELVFAPGRCVGFSEAGVIEGAVLGEAADEGFDGGGIESAGAEFLAEIPGGDGTLGEQGGSIGLEASGVEEFRSFAERHDWSLACTLKAEIPTRRIAVMEERNSLPYFVLGLGVGLAVGLLFAPKPGEETRALLRGRAEEGKDLLKRKSEELRESATDFVERGRDAVSRQREQVVAAVEAGRQAYRETRRVEMPEGDSI
jgi:gas vesicle protein